ncbi:MAG: PKD domain-containing protein [Crocinitomix sp.]|nr:PKD domain-containing protein [Crocinitomix sp.]
MKQHYIKLLFLLLVAWIGDSVSFGQIVGTSAYIYGDNVEIGINDAGHEGAPRQVASNNRSNQALGSPVYFGFVANPQLDAWGNYDGDFFTPGSPENGFGIEVAGVNYGNNASGSLEQIPGSISSYNVEGDCIFVEWDGEVANVEVHVVYRLITTELYYTTEVTLTNTGGGDLTDVYYYRNLDPDNNVTIGGGYGTQNTIVAQPTPECEKALVTATQTGPWDSYIGLGAIGEAFRVSYGGFANRDASNIWNGIGGLTGVEGASVFADQAISLSYKTDLAVAVPETFLFTVVLDAAQIDAAIASLYYFDYLGGGGLIDECAPVVDTAYTCAGIPVELTVDGPSAEDYIWTWAPPGGLDVVDGPTVNASPLVTTEYTVTGTPAPVCLSATIEKTIVVVVTPSPIIEIIDPGPQCGEFDLTTLVINNLEGSAVDISFYDVVPDSIDQVEGLWVGDFIGPGDVVYVLMVNPISGCYDVEPIVIDFDGGAIAGPDNAATLCNDAGSGLDLNTLLVGADLGGVWSETTAIVSGGFDDPTGVLTADGVDPGVYTFEYIAIGLDPCEDDTAEMVITINLEALAGLDGTASICNTDGTTIDLDDLLDGNNGIGTWLETTASGQFNALTGVFDGSDLAAGDYTFTYTVDADAPCVPDVADFTITILPNPPIDAGVDFAICDGDECTLTGAGAGIGGAYDWDGGVTDGVAFTPGATATYTVTGTDANGCINTDDIIVTVNPLPAVDAGVDFPVCDGDLATLTGAGAGVGGVYIWDGGVTDGVAFTPLVTATYTVTGTDANGCVNTDDIEVTVNPLPAVDAGPDFAVCDGDPVTLSGTGAGVGGVYVWDGGVTDGVAFTPLATATYTLTGTDANGCVNTDDIEVIVNPLPTIDAGVDFAICDGDECTLAGAGAGIGGAYDWDGGVTDGAAFTPGATATYTVTGTDANGCINTDDIIVTVNPLPAVDAGVDFPVCDGDLATLTGAGAGVGGVYIWDGGVTDGVAFTPLVTATYTVTGTDANGCVNTDDIEVTVNPLPAVDAGPDFAVCDGDPVTLSGTGAGVGGVYLWDGGVTDGVAFTPLATATYTLTGTDANGCVNTDDIEVIVNPLPLVDAGPDVAICLGDMVTLAGGGAGIGAGYLWTGGGVDGVAFSPAETDTYTVTGTDINGCVNTDDVTVTVNPLPAVDAGPDVAVCDGDPVTLTGSGAGVGGVYLWDGGITDAVAFTPLATATYTVTGTDVNGCVNTDAALVTVNPIPTVSAGPDVAICAGDMVTLIGTGAGIGAGYLWTGGGIDGVPFSPGITGSYTVTGTDANGCVNTDDVMVTVNPLPLVTFTADELIGCAPLFVNFTALEPGTEFEWEFGDGTSGSTGGPGHTFLYPGTYDITLTITSSEGCVASVTYNNYIDIDDTPVAQFSYSPYEIDVTDTRVYFSNSSIYADVYTWEFGDGTGVSSEVDPEHMYPPEGDRNYLVTLTAMNANGCEDVVEQMLNIKDVLLYHVPNAFTPDGDMFNEEFKPIFISGLDIYDYHFMIFNRWGEMVFESFDANFGWDGFYGNQGIVDDGVYIWKMEFGETMSDKKHYVEGHLSVLK